MSKESVSSHVTVYAGIDVSAATLAVAVQRSTRRLGGIRAARDRRYASRLFRQEKPHITFVNSST
jgi:hypothetical protein